MHTPALYILPLNSIHVYHFTAYYVYSSTIIIASHVCILFYLNIFTRPWLSIRIYTLELKFQLPRLENSVAKAKDPAVAMPLYHSQTPY